MDTSTTNKQKRPVWQKLLISLGSLVLMIGATEAGLRMAGFAGGPARYYEHEVGYVFFPNQTRSMRSMDKKKDVLASVTLNEVGCRGEFYGGPKQEGVMRIACVGDSYTFGWAVEDDQTYPHVLLSLLKAKYGSSRIELMNFAIPGFNTLNELAHYRRFVSEWQPDIVILGYVLNDIQVRDPGYAYMKAAWFRAVGFTCLLEAFNTYVGSKLFQPESDYTPEESARAQLYTKNSYQITHEPEGEIARHFWKTSMDALTELDEEVKSVHARLLLVSFPSSMQCNLLRHARRQGALDYAEVLARQGKPQVRLDRHAKELGIPFLNLLPAFVGLEQEPFGPRDMFHPSVEGYKIAAEEIAVALDEWLEVPK